MAIFLMTSHMKGISSCHLARDIGVTQKTAWFMPYRIRHAAMTTEFNGQLTGTIEMDEAYVGANPKFMHKSKKPNLVGMAAAKEKKIVVGMLQRDGELRVHHVKNTALTTVRPLIEAHIQERSRVHTDDNRIDDWMGSRYAHAAVRHSLGEYVVFDVTTNRIEGAFSHFKRTIVGTYHKASNSNVDRYLQVFAYRWNTPQWKDAGQVNDLLTRTKGRRLTYKMLIGQVN